MPPRPTRHRAALALALLGVAVSWLTLDVHRHIAASAGYTSFCNINTVVNCDAVLGSSYSVLLGVPVATWGLLGFAMGAVLAVPGAFGAAAPLADLALIGVVAGGLGFGLVFLGVAVFVLHRLCLLCLAGDLVILAWFAVVAPLARGSSSAGPATWMRRSSVRWATLAAGFLVSVVAGVGAAVRPPLPAATATDVRARDPKFYDWYTELPVRPVSELADGKCHRKGGGAPAAVSIVEFSDFQCPFCAQAARDLHDLMQQRPEVTLVFRHFPLDTSCNGSVARTLHPNACLAACAAECAGLQGRFWEYHDVLFENHASLERESLLRYARDMQLDLPAFGACLDDPATRARVDADVAAATRVGVTSTPTLFFNGRAVQGALNPAYYDYVLFIERTAHTHPPGGTS